jgi:hypothetical protein
MDGSGIVPIPQGARARGPGAFCVTMHPVSPRAAPSILW